MHIKPNGKFLAGKLSILLILPITGTLHAATTIGEFHPVFVGTEVPDNSAIGLADTRMITSTITSITSVEVAILLTGGWAGDMYAYLSHGSGFSVLLNRPGRTLAELSGSGVSEINVTFSDSALIDLHTAIPGSGAVAGYFEPDARETDPAQALDSSPRTAFFSSFSGLDANGGWTLYVADVAAGDTMALQSWTLTITGIPEPGCGMLMLAGACCFLRRVRRPMVSNE
jgi:subtilisin-like proprotein convertase family protein